MKIYNNIVVERNTLQNQNTKNCSLTLIAMSFILYKYNIII